MQVADGERTRVPHREWTDINGGLEQPQHQVRLGVCVVELFINIITQILCGESRQGGEGVGIAL